MTRLERFTDAYASMLVAQYEPLILRWVSGFAISHLADALADRPAELGPVPGAVSTAIGLAERVRLRAATGPTPAPASDGSLGRVSTGRLEPALSAARAAELVGASARPEIGVSYGPALGRADGVAKVAREAWMSKLVSAARSAVSSPTPALGPVFAQAVQALGGYTLLPLGSVEEAVSPIGIAHYYRQLYFSTDEGVGPLEVALTVAPLETLEVSYENVHHQVHEEEVQLGSETVSETASTEKDNVEVSDKVASMVQRDMSAAISASSSASVGVWSGSASVDLRTATQSQRSTEEASSRLKEITKSASERITKTFQVRTTNVDETTLTNLTRRTIRNESADPVSYGLRRVLRKVHVSVQDLGPRLVWQLYLPEPGSGLARANFVQFAESQSIATPDLPPGLRPRPHGGTEKSSQAAMIHAVKFGDNQPGSITIAINPGADRTIKTVEIEAIHNLEGSDEIAVPSGPPGIPAFDTTTGAYTVSFGVIQGGNISVQVDYAYIWEPSQKALDEWESERQQARATLDQQAQIDQFERHKALITERSKVRARAAADLRREERFEVLSRLVKRLFGGGSSAGVTPLEIEYFHLFFDVDALFVYTHPSWWKPHYAVSGGGATRPPYEVTAESESAPMGASLGWEIQTDGDRRRNEFLNSPWVRACLPIRLGRERDALAWLAKHAEGDIGYDPTTSPLADLLSTIDARRQAETSVGTSGPDWATVYARGAGTAPEPASPQGVYPIVSEFDITVPTEGFVYDRLELGSP